jgi:cytochrome b pre-mRNA-processing protein 3
MLNIFHWVRSRGAAGRTATELYGSIVAQARHPDLYAVHGVADVAEKRYELIVLHLFVMLERLRSMGEAGRAPAQAVAEAFVSDLDGSMREMAVGDMSIPRKVRKAAGGFYDRDRLYRQAFEGAEEMTPAALIDELILDGRASDGGEALARYAQGCRAALAAWSLERDGPGAVPFPEPAAFVADAAGADGQR